MIEHPVDALPYAVAIKYVEDWLNEHQLEQKDRDAGFAWHVVDYHDGDEGNLLKRPWTGVRVAEVDCHNKSGGGSYMQVDMPWGVAMCGQVERCILALVENWNRDVYTDDAGESWGETDNEFWRLKHLFELTNNTAALRSQHD
jgi:hypothetical protein